MKNYDCALIVTDHDKFNYLSIKKNFKLIFDCRGVYKAKKFLVKILFKSKYKNEFICIY